MAMGKRKDEFMASCYDNKGTYTNYSFPLGSTTLNKREKLRGVSNLMFALAVGLWVLVLVGLPMRKVALFSVCLVMVGVVIRGVSKRDT